MCCYSITYDKLNGIWSLMMAGKLKTARVKSYHILFYNYAPEEEDLKLLVNYTNCQFGFDAEDLKNIIEPIKNYYEKYHSVKIAEIVTTPIETAYCQLFSQMMCSIPNIKYNYFCTKDAAIQWLKDRN